MEKVHTNDLGEGEDTGPMFQILFLEGGGRGICRGELAGGARFFILYVDKYNTSSHTWARGSGEKLP